MLAGMSRIFGADRIAEAAPGRDGRDPARTSVPPRAGA
jgi:hypothetical protein